VGALVDDLLERRVTKTGEVPVNAGDVMRWCEAHRERAARFWPDRTPDWVAPPASVTTYVRPLEWRPDREGPPSDRGAALHELLKTELGYPLGIAVGYELELHALLRDGDRLVAEERIASVGEEEHGRLGPGRRWVIENRVEVRGGALAAVERFHMLGYHPAAAGESQRFERSGRDGGRSGGGGPEATDDVPDHVEELDVTTVGIVMAATANRVWTPVHLDRTAAATAGFPDVFVDTSAQLGLLSVVAAQAAAGSAGTDTGARPGRLELRMRRPILPGTHLRIEARITGEVLDAAGVRWRSVAVTARSEATVHSTLQARLAVEAPAGADVWALTGDDWTP
jgi:acyl dehydratase